MDRVECLMMLQQVPFLDSGLLAQNNVGFKPRMSWQDTIAGQYRNKCFYFLFGGDNFCSFIDSYFFSIAILTLVVVRQG